MINTLSLNPGDRIELTDGRVLMVSENMGDGQWVEASDDGSPGGDLVHSQEIARLTTNGAGDAAL